MNVSRLPKARITSVLTTAEFIGWMIVGIGALSVTDARFAELGYAWINRYVFGVFAVALSCVSALLRWELQEHPTRWGVFQTVAIVPIGVIGFMFLGEGSPTGLGFMAMICFGKAVEVSYHRIVTAVYEALRAGVLVVAPSARSPQAERFRRIADGAD